jgi:predicted anti-sigma-YlaC factor YlaD
MECLTVKNTLSDYLDNGLPEAEAHQFAAHLIGCENCQKLELQLAEIRMAARDLPLHTPSRALWTRISNTIEAEGLLTDPRATRPMKKETWLDALRERWAALSFPQLVGAGAMAALLVAFGSVGVYRQFSGSVNMGAMQTAAILPEESRLKAEFEQKFNAFKAKMTGWDAQRRTAFESDLSRLEKSLETCRTQLAAHPQDAPLIEQMRQLYAQKSALLDQAK